MADYRRPLPQATPETAPFWAAVKNHELHLQRCKECGHVYFPPRPFCPVATCASGNVESFKASGKGTLHSYVINHRAPPAFQDIAPYAIAAVELEEGPRLAANIVGIENTPENLVLDMALEVVFEDVTETQSLYRFRPSGGAA
ncbi:MAG: Zn-ribbon domain-containing OB-fold protein [Dehalococcoidia bacterium]